MLTNFKFKYQSHKVNESANKKNMEKHKKELKTRTWFPFCSPSSTKMKVMVKFEFFALEQYDLFFCRRLQNDVHRQIKHHHLSMWLAENESFKWIAFSENSDRS